MIEQYFALVMFIVLNSLVLTFEPVNQVLKCDQFKPIKQHFALVLLIMLHEVVLTFELFLSCFLRYYPV